MENDLQQFVTGKQQFTVIFRSLKEELGGASAQYFGFLRQFCLTKGNIIHNFSQARINGYCGITPRRQAELMKDLAKWGFLSVERNEIGNILSYTIHELNFQLFLQFPEQYKKAVNSGTIKVLCSAIIKNKEFINKDLAFSLAKGAVNDEEIDIQIVINNLEKLETKHTQTSNSYPAESAPPRQPVDADGSELPCGIRRACSNRSNNKFKHKSKICENATEKPLLKRRSKVQTTASVASKIRNAPVAQKTVTLSDKQLSINAYYEKANFVRIQRHWNSYPCLRKISTLQKFKANKSLNLTVLAVQALLSGRLEHTGITDTSGRKHFAVGFHLLKEDEQEYIDLAWLMEKITILAKIVEDTNLQPRNKDFLRKLSLGDFILGSIGRQERNASVLFQYCCQPLKTVWEDPNEKETGIVARKINLYTEKEHNFDGKDLQLISTLAARLLVFAETKECKRSSFFKKGHFSSVVSRYLVILSGQWKGKFLEMKPNYIAGEHAWGVFMENLQY